MKLDHIAADLARQANHQPGQPARAKLPRGLVLSCKRIDRRWTLTAARIDVHPSTDEALIIARTFHVPLGTDPTWAVRNQQTQSGLLRWYTITWTWLEDQPAPAQTELIPSAAPYP